MNKSLNILILLFCISFILSINTNDNPRDDRPKWSKPITHTETEIEVCSLYLEEAVDKYIFAENGTENIYKAKYKNYGNSEKCSRIINMGKDYSLSDIKIEGGNNLNYTINSTKVEVSFILKSGKEAIISFIFLKKFSPCIFFREEGVNIEKNTKYIFRAKQPFEIVGTKYGYLNTSKQKNGALYCYYNGTEYGFYDYIILSVYGIKFNSELSVSLSFTIGRKLKYLKIPNYFEFGNNEIISSIIETNLKSNEYTVENDKRYITIKSGERYRKFDFTFKIEFQSKLSNNWVMDAADLVNTCTDKTKNKVNEILLNSNSVEKDYIILGKWINNNIEYNSNYLGAEMSVDEILEKKVGVCAHITRLYNSFLNCIGIDAIYTKGYAQSENSTNINLSKLHAWTVAKIEGKWQPLDATWGLFNEKLHLGHIFRYFGDIIRDVDVDWKLFFYSNMNRINKIYNIRQLSDNPQINHKVSVKEILSREEEDDNEGDFDLVPNSYIHIIIIIIIIVSIILISFLVIRFLKKRRKKSLEKSLDNSREEELRLYMTINT